MILRKSGFSLIEIMVVIFIIGIMATIISVSVSAPNYSRFLSESIKLANAFEIISDEAVYTNSLISCEINPKGITCEGYRNGEWRDINMTDLISWGWPKNLEIKQIIVSGIALKDEQRLEFLSNGDTPLMSIEVSDGVYNAWIDSDLTGKFKVSN
jgi:prepilin-type N-terminal cleavage/methylation domain-containing protein